MTEDLTWISITTRRPQDRQLDVPQKVTFHAPPTPRWEGASIVYDFQYFAKRAAFGTERKPLVRGR